MNVYPRPCVDTIAVDIESALIGALHPICQSPVSVSRVTTPSPILPTPAECYESGTAATSCPFCFAVERRQVPLFPTITLDL